MYFNIPQRWSTALADTLASPEIQDTLAKVQHEYAEHPGEVFPPQERLFAAFDACSPEDVKVVIIGQDPYHGDGQADGLAFSVPDGVKFPPSLRNILKEVSEETGAPLPTSGSLQRWASQGVLLLNNTLSVAKGRPLSHASLGWQRLTDAAVKYLGSQSQHIVFMLWGADAIRKRDLIDESRHLVLTAPHPSPLAAYRGYFGCGHFSKANEYLASHGRTPIVW